LWSWGSDLHGVAMQDELEAELEDLEQAELEERLLQPSTTQLPPVSVPAYSRPTQVPAQRTAPQKSAEDDELAELQAEMAL
jgi:charged multivesicular body protein 4